MLFFQFFLFHVDISSYAEMQNGQASFGQKNVWDSPNNKQAAFLGREMTKDSVLPKIEISKENKLFRVDWDYQEAPESDVLHHRNLELTIFIDGVLVGLGVSESQISCASGRTGTVKNLDENIAKRLAKILEELLHPLVSNESSRIERQEKLPEYLRAKHNK